MTYNSINNSGVRYSVRRKAAIGAVLAVLWVLLGCGGYRKPAGGTGGTGMPGQPPYPTLRETQGSGTAKRLVPSR